MFPILGKLSAGTITARRFFKKAITSNGVLHKIVIDKSGANLGGAQAINAILKITGTSKAIEILQVKYLNNILEQDHRFIKRIARQMLGFKAFHSASAIIAGIEVAHMIRKNQFTNNIRSPFKVFAELAASAFLAIFLSPFPVDRSFG